MLFGSIILLLGIFGLIFFIIENKKCNTSQIIIPLNGNKGNCPNPKFLDECNIECNDGYILEGDGKVTCSRGIINQNETTCITGQLSNNCIGEWSEWSSCNCATKKKRRTYEIISPRIGGGAFCPHSNREVQEIDCSDESCNNKCIITAPINGNLGNCSTELNQNEVCSLECNNGDELSDPILQPYCNAYGILESKDTNGNVINRNPRIICTNQEQCPLIIPPNRGIVPGNCNDILNINESCELDCDEEHTTITGNLTISCINGALDNPSFNNICGRKCRTGDHIPQNSGIDMGDCGNLIDSGSICNLGCDDRHTSVNQLSIECNDGVISPDVHLLDSPDYCKEKCPNTNFTFNDPQVGVQYYSSLTDEDNRYGRYDLSACAENVDHNMTCTLSCSPGYIMVGPDLPDDAIPTGGYDAPLSGLPHQNITLTCNNGNLEGGNNTSCEEPQQCTFQIDQPKDNNDISIKNNSGCPAAPGADPTDSTDTYQLESGTTCSLECNTYLDNKERTITGDNVIKCFNGEILDYTNIPGDNFDCSCPVDCEGHWTRCQPDTNNPPMYWQKYIKTQPALYGGQDCPYSDGQRKRCFLDGSLNGVLMPIIKNPGEYNEYLLRNSPGVFGTTQIWDPIKPISQSFNFPAREKGETNHMFSDYNFPPESGVAWDVTTITDIDNCRLTRLSNNPTSQEGYFLLGHYFETKEECDRGCKAWEGPVDTEEGGNHNYLNNPFYKNEYFKDNGNYGENHSGLSGDKEHSMLETQCRNVQDHLEGWTGPCSNSGKNYWICSAKKNINEMKMNDPDDPTSNGSAMCNPAMRESPPSFIIGPTDGGLAQSPFARPSLIHGGYEAVRNGVPRESMPYGPELDPVTNKMQSLGGGGRQQPNGWIPDTFTGGGGPELQHYAAELAWNDEGGNLKCASWQTDDGVVTDPGSAGGPIKIRSWTQPSSSFLTQDDCEDQCIRNTECKGFQYKYDLAARSVSRNHHINPMCTLYKAMPLTADEIIPISGTDEGQLRMYYRCYKRIEEHVPQTSTFDTIQTSISGKKAFMNSIDCLPKSSPGTRPYSESAVDVHQHLNKFQHSTIDVIEKPSPDTGTTEDNIIDCQRRANCCDYSFILGY